MSNVQTNQNISIENAKIIFRNFSGLPGKFNKAGDRNFSVLFETPDEIEFAKRLEADGWNVKWLDPRDEDDDIRAHLSVALNFSEYNPPTIVLITSNRKTTLHESMMNMLDWAEIKTTDIIIRPYNWEVNGRTGIKAYVKALYVTIVEDEFAKKYADIQDSTILTITEDEITY